MAVTDPVRERMYHRQLRKESLLCDGVHVDLVLLHAQQKFA